MRCAQLLPEFKCCEESKRGVKMDAGDTYQDLLFDRYVLSLFLKADSRRKEIEKRQNHNEMVKQVNEGG